MLPSQESPLPTRNLEVEEEILEAEVVEETYVAGEEVAAKEVKVEVRITKVLHNHHHHQMWYHQVSKNIGKLHQHKRQPVFMPTLPTNHDVTFVA